MGYAALSSYISATRESVPDLDDADVRRTLQRLVNTGKLVCDATVTALSVENPDRVVLFNGRLAADRAVLRCCQQAGVECYTYEITRTHDHVSRFRNTLPEDIGYTRKIIDELWANGDDDKVSVAESFFERTRNGVPTHDPVYIKQQNRGTLPASWSASEKNIVIFASSEDEYAAIGGEWENNVYPSQADAVARIAESLAESDGIRLHLRLHPFMIGINNSYLARIQGLAERYANLNLIPAESDVCSYTLLDHADQVVTFGSTIGIEATYWGKPSILLSNCFHRDSDVAYAPRTHDEVIRLIRSELPAKDRLGALRMGYYRMRHGFRQQYYEGDFWRGSGRGYSFKGDPIRVRGLTKLAYRLAKHRHGRAR